jgi:hypothetical protein
LEIFFLQKTKTSEFLYKKKEGIILRTRENDRRNEEQRPRAPQAPNPNSLEENFEDLDMESSTMQTDGLELVQTNELEPFYIFNK